MIETYRLLVYFLFYIGLFLLSFYALSFARKPSRVIPEKASDKTVSILIPAYNEEASIIPTLRSALALDYPRDKLEIIVIDDGSRDKTYERALSIARRNSCVKVITQKNQGKARSLNNALKIARGEIILSMDADTFARPDALQRMIARFYSPDVMAVTASVAIDHPRTFWQRIQHVEYYLTVFFRRALSFSNAIYITSGAFSAYRASFFKKHGGYAEGTITEDLEIALRLQSYDYRIEYAPSAVVYTIAPSGFRDLLYQRRRWYTGLIRNLWNYRYRLFGFKRGVLGTLILPSVIVSIILSLGLTFYTLVRAFNSIVKELSFLHAINFQFSSTIELNAYLFHRLFFTFFSEPLYVFLLFFIVTALCYLAYARKRLGFRESVFVHFILFSLVYSLLFSFWWIVSVVYLIFNQSVSWRPVHA